MASTTISNSDNNPYCKTMILQSKMLPTMPQVIIGIINSYSAGLAVLRFSSLPPSPYSSFNDTGPGAKALVNNFINNLNKFKKDLKLTNIEHSTSVLKNILIQFGRVDHAGRFPQRTFDAYCSSGAIATIDDLPTHVFILEKTLQEMYAHSIKQDRVRLDTSSTFESGTIAACIQAKLTATSLSGPTPLQDSETTTTTSSSSVQADSPSNNPS